MEMVGNRVERGYERENPKHGDDEMVDDGPSRGCSKGGTQITATSTEGHCPFHYCFCYFLLFSALQ